MEQESHFVQPIQLIIHHVGPFDHIELNWAEQSRGTLIIGDNGFGKSTIIKIFATILGKFERSTSSYPPSETYNDILGLMNDSDSLIELKIKIGKNGIDGEEVITISLDHRKNIESSSNLYPITQAWNSNKNVRWLACVYGTNRELNRIPPTTYNEISPNPMQNALNYHNSINSVVILQLIINQHINRAFALSEGKNEEADQYSKVIRRIERLFQDGLNMPLAFYFQRNPLRLVVKNGDAEFSINQLSDGTLNLLSWLLDYLQRASLTNWADPADAGRAPGLILIDEIDSHLHPEWQRKIIPLVQELLPYTHIIATTHSPFVVGGADDVQLFRLYRDENKVIQVDSNYDRYYGFPADQLLEDQFVSSLYPPKIEAKLKELSELVGWVMSGSISAEDRDKHDQLIKELAPINPWVANLQHLAELKGKGDDQVSTWRTP